MKIKHIFITVLCVMIGLSAYASPLKVTASIDSTVVEMGSRATITLSVVDPDKKGSLVDAPKENTDAGPFEFIKTTIDTVPTGYKYDITIQAFYPGMATIAPFRYASGTDTASSDVITLKILPVELDSLETINPMESVVNPPRKWYDYIPDWSVWVLLAAILIALIICGVYLYIQYRKTGHILPYHAKPIDPYEWAINELNRLRNKKLAETGKEKEFYTTLVDILRKYLQMRFGINAMEMSSTQIIATLRDNAETRDNQQRIRQILEIADFVKFAKVRPLPDDNIKSYNNVAYFVESTKPQPVEEDVDNKNKVNK